MSRGTSRTSRPISDRETHVLIWASRSEWLLRSDGCKRGIPRAGGRFCNFESPSSVTIFWFPHGAARGNYKHPFSSDQASSRFVGNNPTVEICCKSWEQTWERSQCPPALNVLFRSQNAC